MNTIIVGGVPDIRKSGVVSRIANSMDKCNFGNISVVNGHLPSDIIGKDLILWMPDIQNSKKKNYPVKDKGAVLICSKVMRESYTKIDAVTRIFKMHGNAVIAIYVNEENSLFKFELIDALGNTWCSTHVISELCKAIYDLYVWTKGSIRKSLNKFKGTEVPVFSDETLKELKTFININKMLANKVATHCGNRFFGNYSTRCTQLFPSFRLSDIILVSPRNTDKRYVTVDDMVVIYNDEYIGEKKPSVDTPVQLQLYKDLISPNFMIHGHAYITGNVPTTKRYYPCGDLREAPEVAEQLLLGNRMVNLLNHGFLMTARTIDELQLLAEMSVFREL